MARTRAKTSKRGARKSAAASRPKARAPAVPMRPKGPAKVAQRLDAAARAYAQLIAHPCTAPLAHPIYSGSEGGILVRAESSFNMNGSTSATSGFVHWTPGALGPTNIELLYGESSGATSPATAATLGNAPGLSFVQSNASSVRVVAACMQVTYTGSELNRSGVWMLGRTQGGLIDNGVSFTPANIEQSLEHFSRVSDGTCELVWVPSDMDQAFGDPNVTTPQVEKDRKAALTLAYYNLPTATPVRVRLVAIYEYQPKTGQGIVTPSDSRARSAFSLDDVLNVVQRATNIVRRVGAAYHRSTLALGM